MGLDDEREYWLDQYLYDEPPEAYEAAVKEWDDFWDRSLNSSNHPYLDCPEAGGWLDEGIDIGWVNGGPLDDKVYEPPKFLKKETDEWRRLVLYQGWPDSLLRESLEPVEKRATIKEVQGKTPKGYLFDPGRPKRRRR